MRIRTPLLAGAIAALALVNHAALAQADKSLDERLFAKLAEKKEGALIIDAVVTDAVRGVVRCEIAELTLTPSDGGRFSTVRFSRWSFGQFEPSTGVWYMTPGEYRISRVLCRTATQRVFSGPYARFTVRAGEIVDAGVLRLKFTTGKTEGFFDPTSSGTIEKSVGSMLPESRTARMATMPRATTRAVVRHMTLIGPAKTATKTKQRYGY